MKQTKHYFNLEASNKGSAIATRRRIQKIFVLITGLTIPVAGMTATQRVVSMNLCTDQLLMQIAPKAQIISLSTLASDPRYSVSPDMANGIAVNHGLVEEILPLHPDLVLTSQFSNHQAVILLRGLSVHVLEIPVAQDIKAIRQNISRIAMATGNSSQGQGLIRKMDRQLASIKAQSGHGQPRPVAALYAANGITVAAGTLADQALTLAGFDNLAVKLGLQGHQALALETLLQAAPDVLIVPKADGQAELAYEALHHPALAGRYPPKRRIAIPSRLWNCGTPAILSAITMLADFRKGLSRHD